MLSPYLNPELTVTSLNPDAFLDCDRAPAAQIWNSPSRVMGGET
ncbi:hypothetical protein NOR51B_768 [Luminiphilus syltensis NOR5-1B]|uniref:Uncharacterized protein n=1 Tax=Luminiphilus syltensis NOR5-1B TaxID=565045 RepID=B8KV56_9GAMM|nr:hypothetical protein NOR51B_768 [Luminiphilus syltensis NOR5-1B]